MTTDDKEKKNIGKYLINERNLQNTCLFVAIF